MAQDCTLEESCQYLDFRSDYVKDQPKSNRLSEIFDNKIENKNISLIKYMNQKDNISEIFLKKLKESSDLDITKLNKICPIVDQAKKKGRIV